MSGCQITMKTEMCLTVRMSDYNENRDVSDCHDVRVTMKTEMCQIVRMSDYNENRDVSDCQDVRLQ